MDPTMPSLSLPAPAKINLFLHITGQRDNGYHDLQTVFHFLAVHDQLHFTLREDHHINLTTAFPGVETEDNLIVKAARALQQKSGCKQGVDIRIEKNLPMGGGIGGGSSNAATTLLGLNQLWGTQLNASALKTLGLSLGADVPIFIHGQTAWAEGVGENLSDLNLKEKHYVLIMPDCHVSTAEIFSHRQLTRDTKIMKMAAFLDQGQQHCFHNDCEALVKSLHPEVDEALKLLSNFGQARMTGTGACVFAAFDTKQQALMVLHKLPSKLNALVTKGKNRSALLETLDSRL